MIVTLWWMLPACQLAVSIDLENLVPLNRRGLIQATNFAAIILLTTLGTIRFVVMGVEYFPLPALLVVTGCLANAFYLKRNGSIEVAAAIFIGLLLFGLAYGSYNTGGFGGPVILFSPLIPIFTMLLINARAGWICLGLVFLILAGLFVLDLNGNIPVNPNGPERILTGRLITLLCLCLMATWIVWSFARVSRGLLEKIERQSNTDYLTGILNRRAIETTLSHEVSRAQRTDSWLSLIITDVDSFKLYNDNNGHQAGDQCLIRVTRVISSCSERATDLVGRFGGEEFVVILPDTRIEGASKVAERIRQEMLKQNIPYGVNNPNPVTLTLGVVSARGQMIASMEQLIRQADDALYQGKNQGRNCVVSVTLDASSTPEGPVPMNTPGSGHSRAS